MPEPVAYPYQPFDEARPYLLPAPDKDELSFSKSPPISEDSLSSVPSTICSRRFPFSLV